MGRPAVGGWWLTMAGVRSREHALGKLLDASARPVYAIDQRRRLIYCNAACAELVGLDADQLVGQRSDYQAVGAGSVPGDIASSLCPPPEVFSGQAATFHVLALHLSGELRARRAHCMSLGDDAAGFPGVVVMLSAASDERRGEEAGGSEASALHHRLARLRRRYPQDESLDELVGVSPAIQRVRDQLALAARGKTHVLVHGPAGSGREHVARLLHRRAMPGVSDLLVPLWCPLLDAELIQATVTGLLRQLSASDGERPGGMSEPTVRAATVLLLDVDQLPPDAQAELAGFLALPDLELYTIATSGDPLLALAEQGRFRADLAHVLSTLVIEIPPLAARPQDIPLLCQCLVERFNMQGGRQLGGFTSESLDALAAYPWPENVEELTSVVEWACRAADGPLVEPRHLPDKIHWAHQAAAHPRREEQPIVLAQLLEEIEKELMVRALKRAKGNKTKAARLLGVTRARFHRRLEYFGLSG